MTASIGSTAASQSMEVLGAVMANKQQKQEAKITMQLLQSAATSAPPPVAVGNIGQNINIKVSSTDHIFLKRACGPVFFG